MPDSLQYITLDPSAANFAEIVAAPSPLTAAEAFGAASERVTAVAAAPEMWAPVESTLFQVAVSALAIFYIIIAVYFGELILYYLSLTLGGGTTSRRRPAQHSASGERGNCEAFLAIAGFMMIALAGVRFGGRWIVGAIPLLDGTWRLFGAGLAAILALAAMQYGILRLFGMASGHDTLFAELRTVKLRHFATATALLLPAVTIALLARPYAAALWLRVLGALCSILVLLFTKETFSLFKGQKVSILHWILYLCTVEAFPISLLLAPVLRAG